MKQPQIIKPVQLATAFEDAGSLKETYCHKILTAACRSQTKTDSRGELPNIYIRVPRGDCAWACYPDEPLLSECYPRLAGWHRASELAKSNAPAFVVCWLPEPEITHVALEKSTIEELIEHGHTKAHQFSGWLSRNAPMSRIWVASGNASSITASSVFIRLAISSMGALAHALRSDPAMVNESTKCVHSEIAPDHLINAIPDGFETEMKIGMRDLYVDSRVVLYLRDADGLPLRSDDWDVIQMRARSAKGITHGIGFEDLFNLRGRVPGVEAMYEIAQMQYAPIIPGSRARSPLRKDVVRAFSRKDGKLFNEKGRAKQAARLTRPDSRRNQGLGESEQRDFTVKARNILDGVYSMRGVFVSDSLALVFHAAKQWLKWKDEPPPDLTMLSALKNELEGYGFSGIAELEAIFAFITWTGDGHFSHPPKSS